MKMNRFIYVYVYLFAFCLGLFVSENVLIVNATENTMQRNEILKDEVPYSLTKYTNNSSITRFASNDVYSYSFDISDLCMASLSSKSEVSVSIDFNYEYAFSTSNFTRASGSSYYNFFYLTFYYIDNSGLHKIDTLSDSSKECSYSFTSKGAISSIFFTVDYCQYGSRTINSKTSSFTYDVSLSDVVMSFSWEEAEGTDIDGADTSGSNSESGLQLILLNTSTKLVVWCSDLFLILANNPFLVVFIAFIFVCIGLNIVRKLRVSS